MPAKKTHKSTKSAKQTGKPKAKKATMRQADAKPKKPAAINKALSKSELMAHLADMSNLTKKDISVVLNSLEQVIHAHLSKKAVGEFTLPGLMKCRVVRKPATKARKGINPLTGQEMMFKAKPARNVVKLRPLKKLKEMV